MFENVDGRTDGRTTDDGVTGILIAHLGAFGSGELKSQDGSTVYINFVLANNVDPDEMQLNVKFHLGLPCLPKDPYRGFWSTNG